MRRLGSETAQQANRQCASTAQKQMLAGRSESRMQRRERALMQYLVWWSNGEHDKASVHASEAEAREKFARVCRVAGVERATLVAEPPEEIDELPRTLDAFETD
jgi:hypothetical protein